MELMLFFPGPPGPGLAPNTTPAHFKPDHKVPVSLTGLLTCCLGKKNMSARFVFLPGTLFPDTCLDTWGPNTDSLLSAPDTSLRRTCSLH